MTEVAPLTPEEQIAALQAQVVRLSAPKPSRFSGVSGFLKRVGKGLWAAVASTDAVKQEKSLAALIIARLLINVGASASLVSLVQSILNAAGVK